MANAEFVFTDNVLKVYISGEIDHHAAFGLKDIIDSHILASSAKMVILNFENVSFMDSSGVGLILARYKFCTDCGTSLCVQGINNQTQRILALAGIKTIKEITTEDI